MLSPTQPCSNGIAPFASAGNRSRKPPEWKHPLSLGTLLFCLGLPYSHPTASVCCGCPRLQVFSSPVLWSDHSAFASFPPLKRLNECLNSASCYCYSA